MAADQIHPDLQRVARFLPKSVGRPTTVRLSRQLDRVLTGRPAEGVEVVDLRAFTVRLHRPSQPIPVPQPAMLWIHGGGMIIGNATQEDRAARRYADELGVVVAAVDYRLAPEHPFPVPLDDCHDALVWLAGRDDIDESKIIIGGASAGGGLAAGLALLARDRGEVAPAFQLLVYPMIDDRTATRTDIDERNFRVWNNASNRYGWSAYLDGEPGRPGISPYAAPARHDDLTGLPPAWVGVGTLDLFHDEDVAYAHRLAAGGVPCELTIAEGAFHGFDAIVGGSDLATMFFAHQIDAIRAHVELSS